MKYAIVTSDNLTRLAAGRGWLAAEVLLSLCRCLPPFANQWLPSPAKPTETQEHFSCHQTAGCWLNTQTPQLDSIGLWRFAFDWNECGIGRRERPTLTTCGCPVYVMGAPYSTPGLRTQLRTSEATDVSHILYTSNAIAYAHRAGYDRQSLGGFWSTQDTQFVEQPESVDDGRYQHGRDSIGLSKNDEAKRPTELQSIAELFPEVRE